MKKLSASCVLLVFALSAFAQRETGDIVQMPQQDNLALKSYDTLFPGNALNASQFVMMECAGGGWVLGTNMNNDYAKGEVFAGSAPSKSIVAAIYWFGGKKQVTGAGVVKMALWDMDGSGTTISGLGMGPGTELLSVTESISNLDTSRWLSLAHIALFPFSIEYPEGDFLIGFSIQDCYPDSIGLVSSDDGDGGGLELCWEQHEDGSWYTLQAAGWNGGTLDIDAMVLPVVSIEGIEDRFINGIKLQTCPNPASDHVTLTYSLEHDAKRVLVRVLDPDGKVIEKMEIIGQQAGNYDIELDVSDYPAGTYYYLVNAGLDRLAIKMIVAR
jgi:hypothetical protein